MENSANGPAVNEIATVSPVNGRKSSSAFRFNSSSLFATYPKCVTSKEAALDNIIEKWKQDIIFCIVAHEKHKDGTDHLHVLLKFNCTKNFKRPDFADFIADSHGNYQSCRSIISTMKYVKKDGDYIEYGEAPKVKSESKSDAIVAMIKSGATLHKIMTEQPSFYMMNRAKVISFYNDMKLSKLSEGKKEWRQVEEPNVLMDPVGYSISSWLNKNVFVDRIHKQPQLWIYGPPGVGKTSLVIALEEYMRIYYANNTSKFYDGYSDESCDMVVFDEFKGQKCIRELNQFLEGSQMLLEVKGAFTLKTRVAGNKPVIILSNFSIEDCYKNSGPEALAPLKVRLEEVYVPENYFIKIKFNS